MEENNIDEKIEKIYRKISNHSYSTKVLYNSFIDLDYYIIKALEDCSSKHREDKLYDQLKEVDAMIINDKMDDFEAAYIKDDLDFYMEFLTPSYKVALRNQYQNITSDDLKNNNDDYVRILNSYIAHDEEDNMDYERRK